MRELAGCANTGAKTVIINKTKFNLSQTTITVADVGCLDPLILLLSKLSIICLSNMSIFSVPDEGHYRNASCALRLISMFLLTTQQHFLRLK